MIEQHITTDINTALQTTTPLTFQNTQILYLSIVTLTVTIFLSKVSCFLVQDPYCSWFFTLQTSHYSPHSSESTDMPPKESGSPQKQPLKKPAEPPTSRQTRSATARNSSQDALQSSSQPLAVQQQQVQPRQAPQVVSQVTTSLRLGPNSSVIWDGDSFNNINDFVTWFFSSSFTDANIHEALQNLDSSLQIQQSDLDKFALAFLNATDRNQRSQNFKKLQPQVFKNLNTMAKRERPAQERTDKSIPRLQELMGDQWYSWFFEPYQTNAFIDAVTKRFKRMNEEGKELTEIQTLIHSA